MKKHAANERGIALITVLLLLMMTSAILAGFLVTTGTDTALRSVDRARTRALYAAHGGIEKLTADLGDLFATDFAPSTEDLDELEGNPPVMTGMSFEASDGLGYSIVPANGVDADGHPIALSGTVDSGPYEGFVGLVTPYWLWVTAHGADGAEVRLRRRIQTASIPVFQFGIFSETDLSFFAGPEFNCGGRVHTNGNLFLAAGNPGPLLLNDKVTAFGEVIRSHLSSGQSITVNHPGLVRPVTAPGAYLNLEPTQGSLVTTIGSAQNEPTWTELSIDTYHGYIRNGRTGAKNLQLPLVTVGGTPVALIQRPVVGEPALLTGQRLFSQANVRILLSDTAAAITNLPGVSSTAPIRLDTQATLVAGNANGAYAGAIQPAASSGVRADGYRMGAGTPLIDGFLKVEYKNNAATWVDVTAEWLNLGFTRRNIESGDCNAIEPSPNAIIRFQRVKTVPSTGTAGNAECAGALATDYWPLTLYDTREGKPRDDSAAIFLSGVMHYLEFDVNNFRLWLLTATGVNVSNEEGYTVYFSDRRNNRDAGGNETGEYGDEDRINRASADGVANGGGPEAGEDFNSDGALQTYGQSPVFPAGYGLDAVTPTTLPANTFDAPLTTAARPWTTVTAAVAKANRPLFFRRALKIVNGAQGQLPADGLNITAENPVYVMGPFNATNAAFANPHAAAAIIADAVTLLSPNWRDHNSFANPNAPANRTRTNTYYRFATIAGKGLSFPFAGTACNGTCPPDFGTDGGTHNFLRYLESGGTINFRGAIASLYHSRQATGVYKCCTTVYDPPVRGYNFDIEFLNPSLLPPKTPMFRDVNTTGFMQVTRRP
jgi:hypothetical protein